MNASCAALVLLSLLSCRAIPTPDHDPLEDIDALDVRDVDVHVGEHRGKRGLRLREREQGRGTNMVLLPDVEFEDGVIEVELCGAPRADAAPEMRGFVGLAFRIQEEDMGSYECFYLRPTNGRAEQQLRRNHTTQYISTPDYPWHRLRTEHPGVYESYVDMEPGAWTRLRIEVEGESARLFVHDAPQPCLVVHDLKHGRRAGRIALWIGTGTEAWFRNLRVQPR